MTVDPKLAGEAIEEIVNLRRGYEALQADNSRLRTENNVLRAELADSDHAIAEEREIRFEIVAHLNKKLATSDDHNGALVAQLKRKDKWDTIGG